MGFDTIIPALLGMGGFVFGYVTAVCCPAIAVMQNRPAEEIKGISTIAVVIGSLAALGSGISVVNYGGWMLLIAGALLAYLSAIRTIRKYSKIYLPQKTTPTK